MRYCVHAKTLEFSECSLNAGCVPDFELKMVCRASPGIMMQMFYRFAQRNVARMLFRMSRNPCRPPKPVPSTRIG